jgi:energy-coupling factor transporter transmembrane protein EcfT
MFSINNANASGAQQFDPRAKAIAYILVTILILFMTRPEQVGLITMGLAILIVALRLVKHWLMIGRALLPTLLLLVIVVGLTGGGSAAAGASLRLIALVTAGVLFFATTPPEELGEALQASGLSPQIAFMLEGTLRFVPLMAVLLREVRDAQASRGIRFDGWYLLRNGPALLAPLLVSALRVADDLAEALEARGFGSPQRTPLRDYCFQARDWLLIAFSMSLLAIGSIWLFFG